MCFAAALISSQVNRQTPSPPGTWPGAVFINFPLVFVWMFRWWWSGCCSHYSCLRMWWTTICRCRVSDHLGTDPYATFVVMSILSGRCHLVFTEAGGKVGSMFYHWDACSEKKNRALFSPIRDRASAVVFFVSNFLKAYTFVSVCVCVRAHVCFIREKC